MDVYGLTGGIGSGKTTVAELLEEYGVPVVSADELSRIVVSRGSEGLADVVRTFGPEVLDDHHELDRRKMASIVFQDPSMRRRLEAILHPRIRERFEQVLDALEKAGHQVAVYEVPLLFEKNLQGEMKAVILVTADQAVRTRRVQDRDDITETEIRARMAAQMDEMLKRKRADYIIENNGTRDDLRREVEFLLDRFLRVGSRRAAAELADQSSTRMSTEEVEQEEYGSPSRVRTEIPSGAGLPVDGQPPNLGRWSQPQPRTVTAPAPVQPIAPSTVTAPAATVPAAAIENTSSLSSAGVDETLSSTPRRYKTMPAIPAVSDPLLEGAVRSSDEPARVEQSGTTIPSVGFTAPVAPGLASRSGTPPAPAPAPLAATPPPLPAQPLPTTPPQVPAPPPSLAPTVPQPVTTAPSATVRTEGVPTEPPKAPAADAAIPTAAPAESRAAASDDDDEEPSTAHAGNPGAGQEYEQGPGNRARRRKTMPASHFVDLRTPGGNRPGTTPPDVDQAAVPNVPPAAGTSDSGPSPPPPPPPPIKRETGQ